MDNLKLQIEKNLQSKVLDFLRFPLIVGVLFIHNYASMVNISGLSLGKQNNLSIFYICSTFFSQILGRVAVPFFFFTSGFLFFLGIERFNNLVYLKKLKVRINTLIVPYLFWNIALLFLLFFISFFPSFDAFLNKKPELTLNYVLGSLWNGNAGMPISYQFWFIRDLIITIILTPLIFFYVKYIKSLGLLLLCVLWYFNWWFKISGFSIEALFFFTAGAWFSINDRILVVDFRNFKVLSLVSYPLIVIIDLLTKKYEVNIFIHNLGIIFGICFWINTVSYLLIKNKVKPNFFLSKASFWVFAFHEPLMTIVKKTTFLIVKPQNDILLTILYFAIVVAVIFLSLILYCCFQRVIPTFLRIITGGR